MVCNEDSGSITGSQWAEDILETDVTERGDMGMSGLRQGSTGTGEGYMRPLSVPTQILTQGVRLAARPELW